MLKNHNTLIRKNMTKHYQDDNPLLSDFNTYKQTAPFDKFKPGHFLPAFNEAVRIAREEIEQLINNPGPATFENTVEALERSGEKLSMIQSVFFNLNAAETSPEIQNIAQEVSPVLTDFMNDIMLNKKLFERVKTVHDKYSGKLINKEKEKLLKETYTGFIRKGANLGKEKKEKFRKISRELSGLTLKFGENVLGDTNEYALHITREDDLSGLPPQIINAARQEAAGRDLDGWVFTLKSPSYLPFMKYAGNRKLREELFRAYNSRGFRNNKNNNLNTLKRIIELRIETAQLLGYNNYAEYVLEKRMAGTPEKVRIFLDDLFRNSMPAARLELQELEEFSRKLGHDAEIQQWDWAFYAEKLKKEKYDYDEEMVRPFFKLENVQQGIFDLVNTLYGITFQERGDIPVYHPDVKTYSMHDRNNKYTGILYLDFFPRKGKQGGAWMTSYYDQHVDKNGENIRPHVSLVFNFPEPSDHIPSLLNFNEVTTFLHEFGHGLHGLLSNCSYQSLSGTNVYRDFVELPSQVMENWATEKEWLEKTAKHYKTGEQIPEDLIDKLISSRNFHNGYAFIRQIGFAMLDMAWHTLQEPPDENIPEFEKSTERQVRLLPDIPECIMSTAFSHIFAGGYAAGYYSYKWSEVLDADAFSLFREKGIFDQKTAELFRKNILEKGGTEDPLKLYEKFRGREPTPEPLLERSGLKKINQGV